MLFLNGGNSACGEKDPSLEWRPPDAGGIGGRGGRHEENGRFSYRGNESDLARNPELKLYPGMPATVMIPTGALTAFDYVFRPLSDSFSSALREP